MNFDAILKIYQLSGRTGREETVEKTPSLKMVTNEKTPEIKQLSLSGSANLKRGA